MRVDVVTPLYSFRVTNTPSLFLAGGITGCPDWQKELIYLLGSAHGVRCLQVINPRREHFSIDDPNTAIGQIEWEHEALRWTDAILFWFPAESICPIALYELGAWSMTEKPLFVGMHPEYPRRLDIEIQTGLVRRDVRLTYTMSSLAASILYSDWFEALRSK